MPIMLPTAKRRDGEEQPGIHLGKLFTLRIPLIHCEWQIPETVQAAVCFVTGVSATAYLMDLFGLAFGAALSIVVIHELLYLFQNLLGDPIVGGWITPSIPITSAWLVQFNLENGDRIQALIAFQLLLGLLFLILGFTGIAAKLVQWTPNSVKAGILFGSGIGSIIGTYGFKAVEAGGKGFFMQPIVFTVGVIVSLWMLFGFTFIDLRDRGNKIFQFLSTLGFVPGLVIAFIVGIITKDLALPNINPEQGLFFNPFAPYHGEADGLPWVWENFSLIGVGLPKASILLSAIPMALVAYIIAFGDIVAATEFLMDTRRYRRDEIIAVNANRTNVMCGFRNVLQSLFFPTVVASGPLWTAMMITIAERYKTGKRYMYSIWGGVITFNFVKVICCFIVPLTAIITPILPLSMSITLFIQGFGCFYVAFAMVKGTQECGVAGTVGCVLAIAGPTYGLAAGILCAIVVQSRSKKMKREAEAAQASRLSDFEKMLAAADAAEAATERKTTNDEA